MRFKFCALLPLLGAAALSCGDDFTPIAPPTLDISFGAKMFGVMCDRAGSTAVPWDIEGQSYQNLCWATQEGQFASTVNRALLPKLSGEQAVLMDQGIWQMEAMARRTPSLIAAFNAMFPDENIPVAFPVEGGPTEINTLFALQKLAQAVTPLEIDNPAETPYLAPSGLGVIPSVTQAGGQLLAAFGSPSVANVITAWVQASLGVAADDALEGISGRLGYRPISTALGLAKPVMLYPDLREFLQTFSPRLDQGGDLYESFQSALRMGHYEFAISAPPDPPLVPLVETGFSINRPRTKTEIIEALMLSEAGDFAIPGPTNSAAAYVARRDRRGVVLPRVLELPFVAGADGLAEVNEFDQFLTTGGELAKVDPPFIAPNFTPIGPLDGFGRPLRADGTLLYDYVPLRQTLAGAVNNTLGPLVGRQGSASGEEPEGNTLFNMMRGAFVLYGEETLRKGPYDAAGNPTTDPAEQVDFPSFDATNSPLPALVQGLGQVLADPRSDDWLALVDELFANHQPSMARVTQAMLTLRAISNAHPDAKVDPNIVFWDEFANIIIQLAENPALFKGVMRSLTNPDAVKWLPLSVGNTTKWRNLLVYDTQDVNGFPVLGQYAADGLPVANCQGSTDDPTTCPGPPTELVDRDAPDTGLNRSMFMKFLQLAHDSNESNTCNKKDAVVVALGIPFHVPEPCGLFLFENVLEFYLQAGVDATTQRVPPLSPLVIRDAALLDGMKALCTFGLGSPAAEMEKVTGLKGFQDYYTTLLGKKEVGKCKTGSTFHALTATPEAFERQVFFGASSPGPDGYAPQFPGGVMPDVDPNIGPPGLEVNNKLNDFMNGALEPLSSIVCPSRPQALGGSGGATSVDLPNCSKNLGAGGVDNNVWETGLLTGELAEPNNIMRLRDNSALFTLEQWGFFKGISPMLVAMQAEDQFQVFLDLSEIVYRNWPSADQAECNANGTYRKKLPPPSADTPNPQYNPFYCSQANLTVYETTMAELLLGPDLAGSDFLPALADVITVIDGVTIQTSRGPMAGLDLLQEMTEVLFSRNYANTNTMADRFGNEFTTWSNGTVPPFPDCEPNCDLTDSSKDKLHTTPYYMLANALRGMDDVFAQHPARHEGWKSARSNLVDAFLDVNGTGADSKFANPALPGLVRTTLKLLRQQTSAQCEEARSKGEICTWGSQQLANNLAATFQEPTFGALIRFLDAMTDPDESRQELQAFTHYLIVEDYVTPSAEVIPVVRNVTQAAILDGLQLLIDDALVSALLNAASLSLTPGSKNLPPDTPTGPPPAGVVNRVIQLVNLMSMEPIVDGKPTANQFDPNRLLLTVITPGLAEAVTPDGVSALQVLADSMAEINRANAFVNQNAPMTAKDYQLVFNVVQDFNISETRGLEQFFAIVRNREVTP